MSAGVQPRGVNIAVLQATLRKQGVFLNDPVAAEPDRARLAASQQA